MKLQDLWTDNMLRTVNTIRGIVPLPVGWRNGRCPRCNSTNIKGILITETSDEQDPNLVCLNCGYWWD